MIATWPIAAGPVDVVGQPGVERAAPAGRQQERSRRCGQPGAAAGGSQQAQAHQRGHGELVEREAGDLDGARTAATAISAKSVIRISRSASSARSTVLSGRFHGESMRAHQRASERGRRPRRSARTCRPTVGQPVEPGPGRRGRGPASASAAATAVGVVGVDQATSPAGSRGCRRRRSRRRPARGRRRRAGRRSSSPRPTAWPARRARPWPASGSTKPGRRHAVAEPEPVDLRAAARPPRLPVPASVRRRLGVLAVQRGEAVDERRQSLLRARAGPATGSAGPAPAVVEARRTSTPLGITVTGRRAGATSRPSRRPSPG